MKKLGLILLTFFIYFTTFAQQVEKKPLILDKNKKVYELETACGTCMFKMKGKGCTLAVKFEGKPYFVEGTGIDDHGDAHDVDGFCNAIRKAKVQGEVVSDKFVVNYFELIKPLKK